MTRLLIAGLGSIGRRHLRNARTLGEQDIVLLRSHHATLPEQELGTFPSETDIGEALARHKPDAVIVANPTALHLAIAVPAVRAGCAVLLEKPVSDSLASARELEAVASQTGAPVQVGFQLRFHPCLVRARQLIESGRLGRVMWGRVHFSEYLPAWHPWEDYRTGYAARADLGGGVLLTQCHSLDYLPWLLGDVKSVWGMHARLSDLQIDVEDTAEVGLYFKNGAFGTLHIDFAHQPPLHRLEVGGTAGSLNCDLLAGTLRYYDASTKTWDDFGVPAGWERNTMFLEEMTEFLAAARGERTPACTLEDGIRVMRIIAAAQESQRSGRRISP